MFFFHPRRVRFEYIRPLFVFFFLGLTLSLAGHCVTHVIYGAPLRESFLFQVTMLALTPVMITGVYVLPPPPARPFLPPIPLLARGMSYLFFFARRFEKLILFFFFLPPLSLPHRHLDPPFFLLSTILLISFAAHDASHPPRPHARFGEFSFLSVSIAQPPSATLPFFTSFKFLKLIVPCAKASFPSTFTIVPAMSSRDTSFS